MMELPKPDAATGEPPAADTETQSTGTSTRALHFIFDAQKLMLEEMMFAGSAMLDRAQTETHLFGEFISKLAASHSVKDLRTMCEECGRHQIDFARRDSERLFKHGERMIETAARLFGNQPGG